MISLIIVFILFFSKLLGVNLVYNFLFFPFLIYLFTANSEFVISRSKILKIFFLLLIPIFFIFFVFSNGEESLPFLLFRASSLTLFYLMLFGLIPFNVRLFEFLRYPFLFSLPAIFFIFNPPFFYSYASSGSDYIGSHGLFNAFSISGLFPTSLYFAKLLTAFLLLFNSFPNLSKKIYLPFISKGLNKFLALIFLLFTNRKAYVFVFIIYPLVNTLNTFFAFINSFNLNSKLILRFIITFLALFVGYFVLQFGVGGGDYGLDKIYEETYERLIFYSQFAFSPNNYTFAETGIMMINKLGGYYLYLFTFFALICSIIFSLIKFKLRNLKTFLVTYSFILLFLFKEPHTIFSPSPSSLLLFMIISYFMSKLHYSRNY